MSLLVSSDMQSWKSLNKSKEATCSYHWQRWIIRQSTFNESSNSSNIIKLSTQVSHYYEKIYLILNDPMSGDICADKNVHEMYFVYISSCSPNFYTWYCNLTKYHINKYAMNQVLQTFLYIRTWQLKFYVSGKITGYVTSSSNQNRILLS